MAAHPASGGAPALQPHTRVWLRNPYPAGGDDAYRAAWLPAAVSTRPPWVPAVVVGHDAGPDGRALLVAHTLLDPPLEVRAVAEYASHLNPVTALADLAAFPFPNAADVTYAVGRRLLSGQPTTLAGAQTYLLAGAGAASSPAAAPADAPPTPLHGLAHMVAHAARANRAEVGGPPPPDAPPHVFAAGNVALARLAAQLAASSSSPPVAATAAASPPAVAAAASGRVHVLLSGTGGSARCEAGKALVQYLALQPGLAAWAAATTGDNDDVTRTEPLARTRRVGGGPAAAAAPATATASSISRFIGGGTPKLSFDELVRLDLDGGLREALAVQQAQAQAQVQCNTARGGAPLVGGSSSSRGGGGRWAAGAVAGLPRRYQSQPQQEAPLGSAQAPWFMHLAARAALTERDGASITDASLQSYQPPRGGGLAGGGGGGGGGGFQGSLTGRSSWLQQPQPQQHAWGALASPSLLPAAAAPTSPMSLAAATAVGVSRYALPRLHASARALLCAHTVLDALVGGAPTLRLSKLHYARRRLGHLTTGDATAHCITASHHAVGTLTPVGASLSALLLDASSVVAALPPWGGGGGVGELPAAHSHTSQQQPPPVLALLALHAPPALRLELGLLPRPVRGFALLGCAGARVGAVRGGGGGETGDEDTDRTIDEDDGVDDNEGGGLGGDDGGGEAAGAASGTAQWRCLVRALTAAGITAAAQRHLWRVLAALLHLGNADLSTPASHAATVAAAGSGGGGALVTLGDPQAVANAAALLGVSPPSHLATSLTCRTRSVVVASAAATSPYGGGHGSPSAPRSSVVAVAHRTAAEAARLHARLVTTLYAGVVSWAARVMSQHLDGLSEGSASVPLPPAATGGGGSQPLPLERATGSGSLAGVPVGYVLVADVPGPHVHDAFPSVASAVAGAASPSSPPSQQQQQQPAPLPLASLLVDYLNGVCERVSYDVTVGSLIAALEAEGMAGDDGGRGPYAAAGDATAAALLVCEGGGVATSAARRVPPLPLSSLPSSTTTTTTDTHGRAAAAAAAGMLALLSDAGSALLATADGDDDGAAEAAGSRVVQDLLSAAGGHHARPASSPAPSASALVPANGAHSIYGLAGSAPAQCAFGIRHWRGYSVPGVYTGATLAVTSTSGWAGADGAQQRAAGAASGVTWYGSAGRLLTDAASGPYGGSGLDGELLMLLTRSELPLTSQLAWTMVAARRRAIQARAVQQQQQLALGGGGTRAGGGLSSGSGGGGGEGGGASTLPEAALAAAAELRGSPSSSLLAAGGATPPHFLFVRCLQPNAASLLTLPARTTAPASSFYLDHALLACQLFPCLATLHLLRYGYPHSLSLEAAYSRYLPVAMVALPARARRALPLPAPKLPAGASADPHAGSPAPAALRSAVATLLGLLLQTPPLHHPHHPPSSAAAASDAGAAALAASEEAAITAALAASLPAHLLGTGGTDQLFTGGDGRGRSSALESPRRGYPQCLCARVGPWRVLLRSGLFDALEALAGPAGASLALLALRVQAAWRGHVVRAALRRMRDGVLRLQALVRVAAARECWAAQCAAASRIQACVRRWRVKRRFGGLRGSTVLVQRWWRGSSAGAAFRAGSRGLRCLHTLTRGFAVRCQLAGMLAAATRIQAAARGWLVRRTLARFRAVAATAIQAAWRGHALRLEVPMDMALVLAQGRLARARTAAASSLASAWRGHTVRLRFTLLRACTVAMQRWWRGRLGRLHLRRFVAAVTSVQAALRGVRARREAASLARMRAQAAGVVDVLLARHAEATAVHALAATQQQQQQQRGLVRVVEVDVGGGASSSSSASGSASASVVGDAYGALGWTFALSQLQRSLAAGGSGGVGGAATAAPAATLTGLAVGLTHSVALDSEGRVWSWGVARFTGRPAAAAPLAAGAGGGSGGALASAAPAMVALGSDVVGPPRIPPSLRVRVVAVACGAAHTVALCEGGMAVLGWGDNSRGQLGQGTRAAHAAPVSLSFRLQPLNDADGGGGGDGGSAAASAPLALRVGAIAAGGWFTLALTAGTGSGLVFSCGAAEGCGDEVAAAVGLDHVGGGGKDDGDAGGSGGLREENSGSLPPPAGSTEGAAAAGPGSVPQQQQHACDRLTPAPVTGLLGHHVRAIAAGWDFGCALVDGSVWAWGGGASRGQLGRLASVVAGGARPPRRCCFTPAPVEGLASFGPHGRISALACGHAHVVAATATGRVVVWGDNTSGQLGVGAAGALSLDEARAAGVAVPPALAKTLLLHGGTSAVASSHLPAAAAASSCSPLPLLLPELPPPHAGAAPLRVVHVAAGARCSFAVAAPVHLLHAAATAGAAVPPGSSLYGWGLLQHSLALGGDPAPHPPLHEGGGGGAAGRAHLAQLLQSLPRLAPRPTHLAQLSQLRAGGGGDAAPPVVLVVARSPTLTAALLVPAAAAGSAAAGGSPPSPASSSSSAPLGYATAERLSSSGGGGGGGDVTASELAAEGSGSACGSPRPPLRPGWGHHFREGTTAATSSFATVPPVTSSSSSSTSSFAATAARTALGFKAGAGSGGGAGAVGGAVFATARRPPPSAAPSPTAARSSLLLLAHSPQPAHHASTGGQHRAGGASGGRGAAAASSAVAARPPAPPSSAAASAYHPHRSGALGHATASSGVPLRARFAFGGDDDDDDDDEGEQEYAGAGAGGQPPPGRQPVVVGAAVSSHSSHRRAARAPPSSTPATEDAEAQSSMARALEALMLAERWHALPAATRHALAAHAVRALRHRLAGWEGGVPPAYDDALAQLRAQRQQPSCPEPLRDAHARPAARAPRRSSSLRAGELARLSLAAAASGRHAVDVMDHFQPTDLFRTLRDAARERDRRADPRLF